MAGHRRERAAEQIRLEISEILDAELDDPQAPDVEVTAVDLAKDLSVVKVAVAPRGPAPKDIDERRFLAPLARASGFIRSQLAERLDMRRTPAVEFRLDKGRLNAERVETLLKRIEKRAKRSGGDALSSVLAVFALSAALTPPARAEEPRPPLEHYEASTQAMGSEFRIALYGERKGVLASAALAAFDEVRRIDALISDYRDDSEWSRVNREAAGRAVEVSAESAALLARCLEYSRASDGAFDITVGPLMRVWGFYKGSGKLPSEREIRAALPLVGYRGLRVDETARTVRFARRGMSIDPGGIGKGYAVERAAAILRGYGVAAAMLSAGTSSLAAIGAPPGEPRGWKTTIRDPRDPAGEAATVFLRDEALSTSGGYEKRFLAEGRTYSHIMDPRTGMPARGLEQVAAIGTSALDVEAWSTALYVNGEQWTRRRKPAGMRVLVCPEGGACVWIE